MTRRFRCAPLTVAVLTVCQGALAQPSAETEAQALALFKDAVAAETSGDFAAACPRFDAAMKLFPSPATEIHIAKCFAHDGKLASAWAAFQRALVLNRETKQQARREALDKQANDGAAALEPRLPKLQVTVSPAPAGLKVTEDGQDLPAESFAASLPGNPGPHQIVATAPGYQDWKQTVTLTEGQTSSVAITLTAAPVTPPGAAQTPPGPIPPAPAPAEGRTGLRTAGWVIGGLGIVGLGVGAVAGGLTFADKSSAHCNGGTCLSGPLASARTAAIVSNIGIFGGGALLAGGVALVLVGRSPRHEAVGVAPFVGPTGGGLAMGGRW
jgi:PEGA domain